MGCNGCVGKLVKLFVVFFDLLVFGVFCFVDFVVKWKYLIIDCYFNFVI